MIYPFWRLSEAGTDNLGLACTDDGLMLGHTSLIERRGERYVVRERHEVERLLKRAYHGEPPVDRLMVGSTRVANALNANDQCLARIAAVHLQIPDLPSPMVRDALAAEDTLIKYARPRRRRRELESGAASARRLAAQSRMVRADGRRNFAASGCRQ
jgi:hypothetical protein